MTDLNTLLSRNFGVVSSRQLRKHGLSQHQINQLVSSGQLRRLRRGWFSSRFAQPQVVSAVNAGGVLTGPSALNLHGAWLPPDLPIFVRACRADLIKQGPLISSVVLRGEFARPTRRSVDSIPLATYATLMNCDTQTAVVLIDSLLKKKRLNRLQLEDISAFAGTKGEKVLKLVSHLAESGTESIFRLWLRSKGVEYTEQVRIAGVGRVDFLIGNRLVVEIDSREHHTSEEAYLNDRRRDRKLMALGYLCIRLTYADVVYHLEESGKDVLAVIRRDDHRLHPKGLHTRVGRR